LRQLELARTHLAQLRQDRGAAALVAGLAARIDALPDVAPLPVPAGELLAWLDAQGEQNQSRDPEREAQWLLQAHAELPDDEALAEMAASALNACGAQPEARALLWRFVRGHAQQDGPAAYTLMRWLAASNGRPCAASSSATFWISCENRRWSGCEGSSSVPATSIGVGGGSSLARSPWR
ncbi:hypothetical protein U2453_30875, partial [Klebsiella pneumoniae]